MQDLNVLNQVCVFRADQKNKMAALASDLLRHFRLLLWNRWTEFNENWQKARSQRLLPSLCFRADRKNKMAAPASDWLRHFRLLLWNRWTEFVETWQEARSQRPLPSLCFSGRSVKKDDRHGPWLAETFFTSPLKLLNGIQRNLTGSKISTSSTTLCFSVWVNKNYRLDRSVKKVAHCTQVHDMWPFVPLVYVFIYVKEGGVALMHVYVSEHKVSPYYRTAWRMFMKLGRDEVSWHRTCIKVFWQDLPKGGSRAGRK